MTRPALAFALATLAATGAAAAGDASPPPDAGCDFALAPADGDHLRIDRRTGAVSLCSRRDGRWSCDLLADERQVYDERIAALEGERDKLARENADLRARVAVLEAQGQSKAGGGILGLAGDALGRVRSFVARLWPAGDKPM